MGNLFTKKHVEAVAKTQRRHVVPNHLVPDDADSKEHPNHGYLSNCIKTTKYTVLSFIPKNLFEQFHRFANLYFLFIVLLNWVPQVNAFTKEVAMIPVLFVLAVTAIKDGFEDYRRYLSDKKVNHQQCRVYSRKDRCYNRLEWQQISVGDIIHLSCNEIIPADIVLLRTSDQSGLCHVDTSSLDGENNLKQRYVVKRLQQGDEFHPSLFTHTIECELPNLEVYKFHGVMLTPLNERIPITKNNILLRGCVLRNTDFAEGIVVYAGHDTKALLNNRGPRYKRSKVERQINRDVIWCVILLLLMCFFSSLGTAMWNAKLTSNVLIPFLPYESLSQFSALYQGFIRFWTFVILYQVVIPLSLYVTIELVKIGQVYFISQDLQLYHPESNKRVECRALNITEDLGQIEYVFSDKTGTLTENEMVFRCCGIGGVDYKCLPDTDDTKDQTASRSEKIADEDFVQLNVMKKSSRGGNTVQFCPDPALKQIVSSMTFTDLPLNMPDQMYRIWDFFLLLTVCNTVVVSLHGHQDMIDMSGDHCHEFDSSVVQPKTTRGISPAPQGVSDASTQSRKSAISPAQPSVLKSVLKKPKQKLHNIVTRMSHSPVTRRQEPLENETGSSGDEIVDDEHDITDTDTSMLSENTMRTKYEAESTDELALVQAACSYGCRLLNRTPSFATLWLPREGEVTIHILHTLYFDAERKRMSVIVQHPATNDIVLYCKGADTAIIPQLRQIASGDHEARKIIKETQRLVTEYAKQGLRTLVMAKKVVSIREYQKWLAVHQEAESSLDHRESKLHQSACIIENNLELLGVTGMEDRLQEGVGETLSSLQQAGMSVWVLTGDKQETAMNVACSCKLISFDQDMIILNAKTVHMAKEMLESKLEYLNILNGQSPSSQPLDGSGHVTVVPPSDHRHHKYKKNVALIVDGKTLGFVQEEKMCRDNFLRVAQQCNAVLCCRSAPAQKAYVVKLVQDKLHKLTLAIGDGANDVNMIQTADIGVGISSKEGMQAVMASDFVLPRFFYLKRLLLVHGHWSYDRLARMTLYMFFKNTVFVLLLMWFQIYSGFSGAPFTDDLNLIFYNLIYTALPPIVFGILDQDVSDDLLMSRPDLYKEGAMGLVYTKYSYFICVLDAIWQSLVQFFVPYQIYLDSAVSMWEFGLTTLAGCVWCTLLQLCLETKCWNVLHVCGIALSLLVFYSFNLVYSALAVVRSPPANPYWVYLHTFKTARHWLAIILTVVIALVPRIIIRSFQATFQPATRVLTHHRLHMNHFIPDHNVFATWSAMGGRTRDFSHLREEEVVSPEDENKRSVKHDIDTNC
ncbi:hypothetical protein LSH36_55g03001 [Paralvinella palmiformis]|uniref:Phospholipid-transporting ATPase n=1 Tax=Paralvinella palmiformis TaxID=53620 RepID=A0AAD9K554_9ANNE|nr:hypothetical protein LSH36_55g03001 [Paralvinella palmiformis]